jgi:hypothetical protein
MSNQSALQHSKHAISSIAQQMQQQTKLKKQFYLKILIR